MYTKGIRSTKIFRLLCVSVGESDCIRYHEVCDTISDLSNRDDYGYGQGLIFLGLLKVERVHSSVVVMHGTDTESHIFSQVLISLRVVNQKIVYLL